jgi:hypothetical protein
MKERYERNDLVMTSWHNQYYEYTMPKATILVASWNFQINSTHKVEAICGYFSLFSTWSYNLLYAVEQTYCQGFHIDGEDKFCLPIVMPNMAWTNIINLKPNRRAFIHYSG